MPHDPSQSKPPRRTKSSSAAKPPVRRSTSSRERSRQLSESSSATAIDYSELVSVVSRLGVAGDEKRRSLLAHWLRQSPSWLTSLLLHMLALVVLALWMVPDSKVPQETAHNDLIIEPGEAPQEEELEEIQQEYLEALDIQLQQIAELDPQPVTNNIEDETSVSPVDDLEAAAVQVELSEFSELTAPRNDLLKEVGAFTGDAFQGRGKLARQALVREGGGTPGSEQAVSTSLKWLVRHQNPDGSWNFDHRFGPCQGRCSGHGTLNNAPIGATALALLPFLGAGQTHKQGAYQKVVGAGLYYLARSMKVGSQGGDLRDPGGRMYSHGLATIALCEAYAMTQDKGLLAPAQMAINYTVYAQDPIGGGWRYRPRERGDTSVVGWQVMALKSGHMAYLQVPPLAAQKASYFLDTVQASGGATYGYTDPGSGAGTTAVGLLCRMYLGWKQTDKPLQRGIERLAKQGPSTNNLYYNYYATQATFQYTGAEGERWQRWNTQLRDHLINTQARQGHLEGSWYLREGDHGCQGGGRLYCTAMATMILEVYYRHMPIYGKAAVNVDFPE